MSCSSAPGGRVRFQVELLLAGLSRSTTGTDTSSAAGFAEETIKAGALHATWSSPFGSLAGTRMAVDPTAPKVNRLFTLGGEPFLIRYNSRLPVVVMRSKASSPLPDLERRAGARAMEQGREREGRLNRRRPFSRPHEPASDR